MTAPQLIIKTILIRLASNGIAGIPEITKDNVDSLYDQFVVDDETGVAQDIVSEIREGNFQTDITPDYSRHYESRSVGAKIDDKYVGWAYWFGGGKHGEPSAIGWIEDAYFLDLIETKMVPVMVFKKAAL